MGNDLKNLGTNPHTYESLLAAELTAKVPGIGRVSEVTEDGSRFLYHYTTKEAATVSLKLV